MWVVCFLLFGAGVVWSPILISSDFGSFEYSSVKFVLECASYLATIIAAVFAVLTLSVWRKQFKHSEKFKALSALSDTATGLSVVGDYIYSVTERLMNERLHKAGIGSKADVSDVLQKEWWDSFRSFSALLEDHSFLFSSDECQALRTCVVEMEMTQRKWVGKFFAELREFNASKNDEMVELAEEWRDKMLGCVDDLRAEIAVIRKSTID